MSRRSCRPSDAGGSLCALSSVAARLRCGAAAAQVQRPRARDKSSRPADSGHQCTPTRMSRRPAHVCRMRGRPRRVRCVDARSKRKRAKEDTSHADCSQSKGGVGCKANGYDLLYYYLCLNLISSCNPLSSACSFVVRWSLRSFLGDSSTNVRVCPRPHTPREGGQGGASAGGCTRKCFVCRTRVLHARSAASAWRRRVDARLLWERILLFARRWCGSGQTPANAADKGESEAREAIADCLRLRSRPRVRVSPLAFRRLVWV